jgi:hypothetical protein
MTFEELARERRGTATPKVRTREERGMGMQGP